MANVVGVLPPLPLGEGWGWSGVFEPHAASPRNGSGLQAGARTASEGGHDEGEAVRPPQCCALTSTLSQGERERFVEGR